MFEAESAGAFVVDFFECDPKFLCVHELIALANGALFHSLISRWADAACALRERSVLLPFSMCGLH